MNSQKRNEDDLEFSRAVEVLTRLRHHQGQSAVEGAVKEAAGLDWWFCVNCGSEESHEGDRCTGCRRKGTGGAWPRKGSGFDRLCRLGAEELARLGQERLAST